MNCSYRLEKQRGKMTSGEVGENGVNAVGVVVEASVFGKGTATHGGNNSSFTIQFSTP